MVRSVLPVVVVVALFVTGAMLVETLTGGGASRPPAVVTAPPAPAPTPATATATAPMPAVPRPQEPVAEPVPEPPAAPTPAVAETARDGSEIAAAEPKPSFDVVRVGPDGRAVVAGSAPPGSRVELLDGGLAVGEAAADARGDFVIIPDAPLPPGTRRLDLTAHPDEGPPVTSETTVAVVVPEDVASPDDAGGAALAVALPRTGDAPATVLTPPPGTDADMALGIETVDYDAAGRISVAGRMAAGARVAVYLNGALLGDALADGDGRWRMTPAAPVPPGQHTLRADQVSADGTVLARIEVPFQRDVPDGAPDAAPDAAPDGAPDADQVVVIRPGNSLWHIARRTYGRGTAYTLVYAANRDQIRDPDLIYPGQVFVLPPPE